MSKFDDERLKEKIEVLDGSRSRDRAKAAARIQDMVALLQMPSQLASTDAVGAPTKAEYDRLRADVQMVYKALLGVQAALQKRLI